MCCMMHFTSFLNQIKSFLDPHLPGSQKIQSQPLFRGSYSPCMLNSEAFQGSRSLGTGSRSVTVTTELPVAQAPMDWLKAAAAALSILFKSKATRQASSPQTSPSPLLATLHRPCHCQGAWWRPSTRGSLALSDLWALDTSPAHSISNY